VAQQLVDEERVAAGVAAQLIRESEPGRVQLLAARQLEERDDLTGLQAGEGHGDGVGPGLGHQIAQRVAGAHVAVAVGAGDEDPHGLGPDEVAQQRERRRV